MAGQKIVVLTASQLCSNGFGYKRETLMVKNLIDFFITVGLLLPQFLGLEVGLLQLCLLCLDDNLFKNGSKKAFEPSGPGENLGSLYS